MQKVFFKFVNFIGFGEHVSVRLKLNIISMGGRRLDTFAREGVYHRRFGENMLTPGFSERVLIGVENQLRALSLAVADNGYSDIDRQLNVSWRNSGILDCESKQEALGRLSCYLAQLNRENFMALRDEQPLED